jgi:mono/diheme cytochrome c family protein
VTGYSFTLFLHSSLRWAVLVAGFASLAATAHGFFRSRAYTPTDDRIQRAFTGLTNTQFLLGLALYVFFSPIVDAFWDAPLAAMKERALRFFGMEHVTTMVIAIAILHSGTARAKKAATDRLRFRRLALSSFFTLALMGAAIPWPGLGHGRPLARGFSTQPAPVVSARSGVACPDSFVERCATCHGMKGAGDGIAASALRPPPRNFQARGWDAGKSDQLLSGIIREGGARPGQSAAMPAHSDLSDGEILELVRCVRALQSH